MPARGVQVNIGRIEPLIGSEDFVAVEAMLLRYQGFPDRVKPTWDTLRQHRDKLLTLAKQALLALLDSHDLGLMERTFALYLAYAEAVAVERDRAVAHHDFVLEQAPILLAAAAADLQSTVAHMVSGSFIPLRLGRSITQQRRCFFWKKSRLGRRFCWSTATPRTTTAAPSGSRWSTS